jgi:chitinase
MTKKTKRPQSGDITVYRSLESEDGVDVEIALSAPTLAHAQRVLTAITKAVTGEDLDGGRIVFTDGPGVPEPT